MDFIVGAVIGLIVGWHVPAPSWALSLMEKVKGKILSMFGK